jgi:hypothetical protein
MTCPDEHPLADSSITSLTFPDGSIYGSSAEKTYSVCQFPSQPQIRVTRAVEVQTDCHASWASGLPIPEVIPLSRSAPRGISPSLICSPPGIPPTDPTLNQEIRPHSIIREPRKTASRLIPRHFRQLIFRASTALFHRRITGNSRP